MKFVVMALIASFSCSAFAWGPTGHRVVGEVAEQYLKWGSKRKIEKILDGDSLARVSNWPDKIKSDPDNYSHTYNWHYTDWPDHNHDYDPVNNNGHLVAAIENNIKVLKDKKASKDDKRFALSFIVHLVGDLHQPLHLGNGKDRGGNSCKVVFHKEKTNLHALWDEKMIEFTRLSFTELSRFVNVVEKKEAQKIASGTVLEWARESVVLRDGIYPEEVVADQTQTDVPSYCNRELDLSEEQLPQLGYDYSYKFMPVLERRLLEAGVRLAMILNQAL